MLRELKVTEVSIIDDSTGKFVPAELWDCVTRRNIDDATNHWQPYHAAIKEELEARNIDVSRWPQTGSWYWERKFIKQNLLPVEKNISFAIVKDGMTQAMIFAQVATVDEVSILSQAGDDILYISVLESAPWNQYIKDSENQRIEIGGYNNYSGCGTVLMTAIMEKSFKTLANGWVGFHSLNQALGFYEKLGIIDLGVDKSNDSMHYFEFMPQQTKEFISRRKEMK